MTAESLPVLDPAQKSTRVGATRPVLITIAVLLGLLLVVAAVQLGLALQQNSQRGERAEAALQLVQSQQSIISGLMGEYQRSAYNDPGVDTIYQQQLIAAEHILEALHILAIQNSQIIQLLAVTP